MEPRVVLVTGGNRGIGLEMCRQLAARGLRVLLTARDEEKGRAACRQLAGPGRAVSFVALDLTQESSIRAAMDHVEREVGRLDVLINNAGVMLDRSERGLDVGLDVVRATFETNVFGALLLAQLAIPVMRRNGYGRIVNVSSGLGSFHKLAAGKLAYRLSKTALNGLTCVLADELRDSPIRVNAMTPGWVRTDLGGGGMQGERSVEEGADTAVWLATMPDDGPHGKFFKDREEFPW